MKRIAPLFDTRFTEGEQLPRSFTVAFSSIAIGSQFYTKVLVNGTQMGDIINDNAREADFYRFHDIFHYTFAAMLGWSPCTRSMMKRKRKSDQSVDEIEDGARATITEEAISLLVFNNAKRRSFYQGNRTIAKSLLKQIKDMTSSFEVSIRSEKEWEKAILTGYSLFRQLVQNNGGKVHFSLLKREASFEPM